ncbi:hypothetical protein IAT38_000282 [Cryptococcus sp. DSM 104549]
MPAEAGSYHSTVYAIDISPSMGDVTADPAGTGKRPKIDLVKEYVTRLCEPKISGGRKTDLAGVVTFGGRTNNRVKGDTYGEDEQFPHVSTEVALQSAKPKIVEVVLNLELGQQEGNPISALLVALNMIEARRPTPHWSTEVVLITDGESSFSQDYYEEAIERLVAMGTRLSFVGIGFQPWSEPIDKSKDRSRRLSEKFWRIFYLTVHERMLKRDSKPERCLPSRDIFEESLEQARLPKITTTDSAVYSIELHIGSSTIDASQAIAIPIKYSKATSKASAPSWSRVWKPAMDLQSATGKGGARSLASNPLLSELINQAESQGQEPPRPEDVAGMISAEVKGHHTYWIKKEKPEAPEGTQVPESQGNREGLEPTQEDEQEGEAEEEEEEPVEKDDLVKVWRFGSKNIPVENDLFEPMETKKGVEVLRFVPSASIKRHHLMGEVRLVLPDVTSPRAEIQFSCLVQSMKTRNVSAIVRWVNQDNSEPVIGVCIPEISFNGETGERLDHMFWIKLPFAEDEHNFWFSSLTRLKTAEGKTVEEHPLLPTEEQQELMDELVVGMDLDAYAREEAAREKAEQAQAGDGEAEEAEDEDADDFLYDSDANQPTWYDPSQSFNPNIHRIKEAIIHGALTADLDANPLGPPHPELLKYFEAPEEVGKKVEGVTEQLKEALAIKKVPPRPKKRAAKETLPEGGGEIDIDALFSKTTQVKPETSQPIPAGKASPNSYPTNSDKLSPPPSPSAHLPPPSPPPKGKPKPGRLISNEKPLEDFRRLTEGEGDVFRKAIQDLGAVVKENVESSFSRQAFPLAIDCLKAMRETALGYEEVETYNEYIDSLEATVKGTGFKHPDFWDRFEKAGNEVARISDEEAQEALEG